jgi:hypothetical protein
MEFIAAIHMPEIFGTHPGFIGNFDRRQKKPCIIRLDAVSTASSQAGRATAIGERAGQRLQIARRAGQPGRMSLFAKPNESGDAGMRSVL